MNTKKAIIYDDTCPMCQWYTQSFVENGFLTKEGRISFSELNDTNACQIDFDKGKHEIPLIDLDGGKTIYGLDSLVYLLSQRFPWIGQLMKNRWIYNFFKQIYQIVSYNRRVIAPSEKRIIKYDCSPDFNLKFRLIYIGLAFLISSIIGWKTYADFQFVPNLEIIFPVVIIALMSMALFFQGETIVEYFGQIVTVFFIGSLIVLPVLVLPALNKILLGLTVLVMIWQLIRRIKYCYTSS